jgi:excisionase family DNA binding protein
MAKGETMRQQIIGEKNPTPQPSGSSIERLTYTVEEAAEILGISRALAYRKGVLPTVQIAGRRLVPKTALDRMLATTV